MAHAGTIYFYLFILLRRSYVHKHVVQQNKQNITQIINSANLHMCQIKAKNKQ